MDSKVSGREAPAAGSAVEDAIAAVAAMAEKKLPAGQAAAVADFVRRYYALTAPEDLAERAQVDAVLPLQAVEHPQLRRGHRSDLGGVAAAFDQTQRGAQTAGGCVAAAV